MHTNEENKLSEEGLLGAIERHLDFFKYKGFAEAKEIAWRMSELAKLPSGARQKTLKAVYLKLNKASGRYCEGRPATQGRLEDAKKLLEEALSKAEEVAVAADDFEEETQKVEPPSPSVMVELAPPSTPGEPWQSKTPTWPYGLLPLEEASPPKHKAPRGSHGR